MIVAAHQTMLAPPALPYDAEVEYLESTGTQYVDTGVTPTTSDSVVVDVDLVLTAINTSDNNILFGSYQTINANPSRLFAFVDSSKKPRIAYGGAASGSTTVSVDVRYSVVAEMQGGSQSLKFDGTVVSSASNSPSFLPSGSMWVFACNHINSSSAISLSQMRLFSMDIRINGTLVRSFVPVRVGQVGYLYDRVSGTLFGNAGTGAFTIGPDKT